MKSLTEKVTLIDTESAEFARELLVAQTEFVNLVGVEKEMPSEPGQMVEQKLVKLLEENTHASEIAKAEALKFKREGDQSNALLAMKKYKIYEAEAKKYSEALALFRQT